MSSKAEELSDLQQKIDWEGGLTEYVTGYGGDMPEELTEQTEAVKVAVRELEAGFRLLLAQHDVEPL